jgi:hypothetical protein
VATGAVGCASAVKRSARLLSTQPNALVRSPGELFLKPGQEFHRDKSVRSSAGFCCGMPSRTCTYVCTVETSSATLSAGNTRTLLGTVPNRARLNVHKTTIADAATNCLLLCPCCNKFNGTIVPLICQTLENMYSTHANA